ncbi:hypothetical protein ACHAQH_009553 [Verticillium albo-atrum]
MNCLLIVCVVFPCIIGSAMICRREHISPDGVRLFAYFLLGSGPGAMPLNLSLVQGNYRGVTKKMTVSAARLRADAEDVSAVAEQEAREEEGFEGTAGGSGAVAGGRVVGDDNNSRDVGGMVDQVELRPEDYDDMTDWKTVGFRYRY